MPLYNSTFMLRNIFQRIDIAHEKSFSRTISRFITWQLVFSLAHIIFIMEFLICITYTKKGTPAYAFFVLLILRPSENDTTAVIFSVCAQFTFRCYQFLEVLLSWRLIYISPIASFPYLHPCFARLGSTPSPLLKSFVRQFNIRELNWEHYQRGQRW